MDGSSMKWTSHNQRTEKNNGFEYNSKVRGTGYETYYEIKENIDGGPLGDSRGLKLVNDVKRRRYKTREDTKELKNGLKQEHLSTLSWTLNDDNAHDDV